MSEIPVSRDRVIYNPGGLTLGEALDALQNAIDRRENTLREKQLLLEAQRHVLPRETVAQSKDGN